MMRLVGFITSLAMFVFLLAGCQLQDVVSSDQPRIGQESLTPSVTVTPPQALTPIKGDKEITHAPQPTRSTTAAVPDTGWQQLRTGLERRVINLSGTDGGILESVYLLRVDPSWFRFDVAYKPDAPQSLQRWQTETGALIVVNAGFFTVEYEATGLIIAAGRSSGGSYRDFGGMLAIRDDQVALRWLPQQPYNPGEELTAAVQSFPMLVKPSSQGGYTLEDGQADRRTVIAQDSVGRILFLLASRGSFTLAEMSRFLLESDLGLESALNLDGGASSGLLLAEPVETVAAFTLLPAVITVHPLPTGP